MKNLLLILIVISLAGCGGDDGGGGGTVVNTAPTLASISNQSTNEDTAKTVTLVGTDVDAGDTLTYSATSSTSNVTIGVSGTTLTLTPASNWNGTATITAKVNNGIVDSSAQTFTLTVSAVNDTPTLASIANQTTNQSIAKTVTLSGTDVDGDSLTYSATSSSANVTIGVSGSTLTLTPTATWNGSATITAKVNDGVVDSDAQTFTLTTLDPLASFELIDPNTGAGYKFGTSVIILGNGNIVVASPNDSSVVTNNGAVHLYNPYTQTRIASFYGDVAEDKLGYSGITALANNNFVITSHFDDENNIVNAGSVRLINGTTGAQIGDVIAGDVAEDQLGIIGITVLSNNNFVIASTFDDENNIVNAGSVRLASGTTGAQIGILTGDVASDHLGYGGITALDNNNFVITSHFDDENSIVDAGSVRLVNGTTGAQIGILTGDTANVKLGDKSITALDNNNFVIASRWGDSGVSNVGSVRLASGTTGAQIGATLAGDVANDYLGSTNITALDNNNFVIASANDDENSIVDAGSVRLVNGATGAQIGATLAGDVANDQLGSTNITALDNNNFVIASALDDENSIVDAGSVRLVNGATGTQIGATLAGDVASDKLGDRSITALDNNNFVITSTFDDENNIVNAGSVRLASGTTGAQIGILTGDVANDYLGESSITALSNNNFVIASHYDDENSIVNTGSVRLASGTTGAQIGATLAGDVAEDKLGSTNITALDNNNFVIASALDDENSIVDAGSIRQINTTGTQVSIIVGGATNDMSSNIVTKTSVADFYIVSLSEFDKPGKIDAGFVTLVAF